MSELTVQKKDNKNKNKLEKLNSPLKEINGFSKLMDYFTNNKNNTGLSDVLGDIDYTSPPSTDENKAAYEPP